MHALADTCNYGVLREELTRDRLVVGFRDRKVSERLQLDAHLNLLKALTVARQHETVRQQEAQIHNGQAQKVNVDNVRAGKSQPLTRKNPGKSPADALSLSASKTAKTSSGKKQTGYCGWCGRERHSKSVCPAKNATCRKCTKKGNFASVCRSTPTARSVREKSGFLGLAENKNSSKWDVAVIVNSKEVVCKVDTGADETVLPEDLFHTFFKKMHLQPARRPLNGPNGKPLNVAGMVRMKLTLKGRSL